MRAGLDASIAERGTDGYPAGSIVLCQACLIPLYRLERGIGPGQRAGRAVDAFKPMTETHLLELISRSLHDPLVSAGMVAQWRSWEPAHRRWMLSQIHEPYAGMPMVCPFCGQSWAYARAVEAAEVHDHAYTLDLTTIPPAAPIPTSAARAWRH